MNEDIITEYNVGNVIVKIKTVYDDSFQDASAIGYYSNTWEFGAIDRFRSNRWVNNREYRYFIPTPACENWENYYKSTREYYNKNGYSKHESHVLTMSHRYENFNLAEDLNNGNKYYIGIVAEVFKHGIEVGQSSVWGYIMPGYNELELRSEGRNIASEAIEQAKQTIELLRN